MMSREAQVQATAVIAGSRGGGGDPVVRTVLRNIALLFPYYNENHIHVVLLGNRRKQGNNNGLRKWTKNSYWILL
ncbi:hypothetical protein ACRAB5_005102, partial [Escherichia coli]|nr:hypothetical protein AB95_5429 [Escherichia coli 7-233-03_S3_C1]